MLDLYEAIDDDAALAQLSGSVAATCGGRSASILHFSDGGERHLMQVHYFSPEQLKLYEEHRSEEDPWRNQIAVLGLQRGVINFDDVLPREQ